MWVLGTVFSHSFRRFPPTPQRVQVVSSHTCPNQYSAECSFADPWISISWAAISSLVLCNLKVHWLPRLTAASSTHELAEPCLASPSFPVAWKLSPGNCRSQLICFPCLRDPSPHDAQCFENCCFLYFVCFSNCFRQKGKFNPYSSIRSRFYRMAFKTKLLYVSPLAPNLQIVSLATLFAKVRKTLHDLITILLHLTLISCLAFLPICQACSCPRAFALVDLSPWNTFFSYFPIADSFSSLKALLKNNLLNRAVLSKTALNLTSLYFLTLLYFSNDPLFLKLYYIILCLLTYGCFSYKIRGMTFSHSLLYHCLALSKCSLQIHCMCGWVDGWT